MVFHDDLSLGKCVRTLSPAFKLQNRQERSGHGAALALEPGARLPALTAASWLWELGASLSPSDGRVIPASQGGEDAGDEELTWHTSFTVLRYREAVQRGGKSVLPGAQTPAPPWPLDDPEQVLSSGEGDVLSGALETVPGTSWGGENIILTV